jgi:hypothetical protein
MPYVSTLSLPVTKTIEACLILGNHEIFHFRGVNSPPLSIAIDVVPKGDLRDQWTASIAPITAPLALEFALRLQFALASSDGLRQGQIGIGRHERTSQN